MTDRTHALLNEPPLRLLMKMTAPNTLAFTLQGIVNLTEIYMIGRLGTEALAAIALVFPLLILVQTMSGGPLGGALTASIARALGNGNRDDAEKLVWHALYGGIIGASVFFVLFRLIWAAITDAAGRRWRRAGNGRFLLLGLVQWRHCIVAGQLHWCGVSRRG